MSKSYVPKTRLEKILCGVTATAKTGIEKAVAAAMASIAGVLPKVTSSDNGKALVVKSGKWQKGAASAPLEATGVLSVNGSGKQVMTLNKTAEELFTAVASGRMIKLVTELTIGEEPNTTTATITQILALAANKLEAGGNTVYNFAAHPGTDEEDEIFCVEDLAGTDTVVLTKA